MSYATSSYIEIDSASRALKGASLNWKNNSFFHSVEHERGQCNALGPIMETYRTLS